MTRREAAAAGLTRYYTGRACLNGHEAQRFTSTGACVKCAAGYSKAYVGKLRKETNARLAGMFVYPAHPDDVAALLAYAQALDLARGRVPFTPEATPRHADPLALPADLERHRQALAKAHAVSAAPAYLPAP